jgi:calcineurin-like phosphoesterase family protein
VTETFFIGDTHFGHRNILRFEGIKAHRDFFTIEEHDEEIVRRWNRIVCKGDIVWHLGDFAFSSSSITIAGRLNGMKKLVLGNHDHYPTEEYLKYFQKVYGAATLKGGILLTHIPVHPAQLERFKFNIHGHLHAYCLDDQRYINVSCEQINLTPVPMDWIYSKRVPVAGTT